MFTFILFNWIHFKKLILLLYETVNFHLKILSTECQSIVT